MDKPQQRRSDRACVDVLIALWLSSASGKQPQHAAKLLSSIQAPPLNCDKHCLTQRHKGDCRPSILNVFDGFYFKYQIIYYDAFEFLPH